MHLETIEEGLKNRKIKIKKCNMDTISVVWKVTELIVDNDFTLTWASDHLGVWERAHKWKCRHVQHEYRVNRLKGSFNSFLVMILLDCKASFFMEGEGISKGGKSTSLIWILFQWFERLLTHFQWLKIGGPNGSRGGSSKVEMSMCSIRVSC